MSLRKNVEKYVDEFFSLVCSETYGKIFSSKSERKKICQKKMLTQREKKYQILFQTLFRALQIFFSKFFEKKVHKFSTFKPLAEKLLFFYSKYFKIILRNWSLSIIELNNLSCISFTRTDPPFLIAF